MSWRRVQLADFLDDEDIHIQTGPFGTQLKASDYVPKGTPVINVRNIGYGDLRAEKLEFVPDRVVARLGKHVLETCDIVFGRKGAVDRHLLVREPESGWIQGSDCIRLRIQTEEIVPVYLSFAFRLPRHKQWMINQCSNKATMASLNQDVIGRILVDLPDPPTQKRIASILAAYDKLIENNQRRIQLLEQAARLLYKEWFVHLRFPGHEHAKIVDGVPEGWERRKVGQASSFISRGITPKYDDEAPGRVINQKCIRHQRVDMALARNQSKDVPPAKVVRFGDVLINSTGKGTLGRVAQFHATLENCTVDSHVTIARPADDLPVHLYGHSVASQEALLATMGRGATNQTELSKDTVTELPLLLPSKLLAEQFEEFAGKTAEQVRNLMEQNARLAQARDLLLPRLMSEEIRV